MPRRALLARLALWWNGRQRPRAAGNPVGAEGERRAERLLRAKGYRTLARNLTLPAGEIDLLMVAPDEATVVVVEVKSRIEAEGPWSPESSITAHKRGKLLELGRQVVRANAWTGRPWRIDVVAVEFPPGRRTPSACRHYEAAVRA